MCRSIKTLFNFDPPATDEEVRAAALQFVRKLSGFNTPSKANEAAFGDAVDGASGGNHHWMARVSRPQSNGIVERLHRTLRDENFRHADCRAIGIRDRPITAGSPWQNGHVERLIGLIRRECLDHVVVLGEKHLRHLLANYRRFFNGARTHLALDENSPLHRPAQTVGCIASVFWLGGLHR